MKRRIVFSAVLAMCLIGNLISHQATASGDHRVKLVLLGRFEKPVDIASRRADTGIYVAQQSGKVVRLANNNKVSVALDLSKLTKSGGERGLLGIAFHPNGKSIFVNYTNLQGDTIVARYPMLNNGTASSAGVVLLKVAQPYANHNGGGLGFGPNGRLFVGTGDGGAGGDPHRYALDNNSLLGKMLSIDPDAASQADNDLVVWSRGLRNPWRFEFDRQQNLWIADVGQNNWEEVNLVRAEVGSGFKKSFGWSAFEGESSYNSDQPKTGHLFPVFSYKHDKNRCSISGGTRVRDPNLVSLKDWYLFGDYCSGELMAIWVEGNAATSEVLIAKNLGSITAVRTIYDGGVYVLTHQGKVYKITKTP